MSTVTGTATDYNDLLARLVTFLTTDATLTGLGQNWSTQYSNTTSYTDAHGDTVVRELILKAPGLSGTEAIYIELQAFTGALSGTPYWNWRMLGATGYNSGTSWSTQPGISPDTFIHLWNTSIPYTFIANGQRAIVIAQIGSNFEAAYFGKILPYAQPSQYPYPLFVGGTSIARQMPYSDNTNAHSAFFDPCSAFLYWIDGSWQQFGNDNYQLPQPGRKVWPYEFGWGNYYPTFIEQNLDGSYPLFPVRLEMFDQSYFPQHPTTNPQPNAVGEFDGVFFTTGVGLSSGSTITVGGATYLAVQNTFRSAANNFAAMLEA